MRHISVLSEWEIKRRYATENGDLMSAFKKLAAAIRKKSGYSKEGANAAAAAIGRHKFGERAMQGAAKKKISVKEWLKEKKK